MKYAEMLNKKDIIKLTKWANKRINLYQNEAIKVSEQEDCENRFYEGMAEGISEFLYQLEKLL